MSPCQTRNILLVGGTSHLGSHVAHHLLQEPDMRLRLLVRPGTLSDPTRARAVGRLFDQRAEVIEVDLADSSSLDRATRGVEVTVSCVQSGPATILDGQIALVDTARRNGVRRILPSDFALDFFDGPTELHLPFDLPAKPTPASREVAWRS